jgi:hypothetical protein
MSKVILLTDCYVKSSIVEQKLKNFLDFFNKDFDICLVSNSTLSREIQNKVNYYIYDSNNRLFTNEFDHMPILTIFHDFEKFRIETEIPGNQPHGLSVLVNLFNQIEYCKSLGYTHFIRLEIDMSFQDDFIIKVKNHIEECFNQSKKGFFYLGDNSAVCQYFFSEIDYFLNNITRIRDENDYKNFILKTWNNREFVLVERFLYENLKDKQEDLILKTEIGLHTEFSQTTWNTEVSQSNLDPKFRGCLTQLARVRDSQGLIVYSKNFSDSAKNRMIKVCLENGNSYDFYHNLPSKGYWSINDIPNETIEIQIYDDGEFLMSQDKNKIKSTYIIK